jgi:hypothetical protein
MTHAAQFAANVPPIFWAEGYSEPVYDKAYVIHMLTHSFPDRPTGERLRGAFTEAINSIE